LSGNSKPKTYDEVEKCPEWREAMAKEIQVLERNNTWVITDLLYNKKTHWM